MLADSPNKLTGAATLKKAIAQRDNLMGGWDRVVVLGWNFEPSIGETITALNDFRPEVLVIPPDQMDRLKKKGGIDKLRGQVRFSSLQYLTIHPVERGALRLASETDRFLAWANSASTEPPLIKAGLAHLWFVTLHPFDDGNGRIARAQGVRSMWGCAVAVCSWA